MAASGDALRVSSVAKAYGATLALNRASLAVRAGEVHALLGENGAGKSTMVKLLSGLIRPDEGTIELFGEALRLDAPAAAHRHGVQTAFQEMTLVKDLTVAENMLLPNAPCGLLGQLRRRRGERLVAAHLERLGLGAIDPRAEVRALELPERQKIEIARAVFRQPRLLLLDEPTSTLTGRDIDWLGRLIEEVRADGVTIVFISHRMPEVRRFCDRLTVLRNGKDVGTAEVAGIGDDEVIRMIIGRSLAATFPPRPPQGARPAGTAPALEARGIATGGKLVEASFSLRPGEILGVAGLQGMGQQELFLSCFGMASLSQGEIRVDGRKVTLASPRDAVHANIGISLVPEDRKTEGLFLKLDGRFNVSLPEIDRFAQAGLIDGRAETAAVAEVLDEAGHPRVQAILADLGLSSMQIDRTERGFAYRVDAPLDMRMDDTQPLTAADLLNTADAGELTRILRRFGEERFADRIARRIVAERESEPFAGSARLVRVIEQAIPAAARAAGGGHPAKRTFQALRIAVNDELTALAGLLPAAIDALAPRGRLAVLAYHSGEDRLVKNALRDAATDRAPRGLPEVPAALRARLVLLTRGAERPDSDEVQVNPRAASARLRAGERIDEVAA